MDTNAHAVAAAAQGRRRAAPWVERLARFGYAAKGVVFLLVGTLAAAAAVGPGGQVDGSEGALRSLAGAPWGPPVLAVLAAGLLAFALWRAVEVTLDPENETAPRRAFFAVSGLIYAALALEAARLALGGGGGSDGEEASHWTALLMAQPLGRVLVVGVGAGMALYGLHQIGRGFAAELDRRLALDALSREARAWVVRIGRAGIAARGVVFSLLGGFLAAAGVTADPERARGVGGALRALAQQPYGPWLLGAVALGLAAYGLYCGVLARWRRITTA